VPAAPAIDPEQLAALEKQIASLEDRLVEQDAALRRVLDLLIEWVERDPENAPNPQNSRTWAA
jgi:general secretion pathway protein A